MPGDAPTPGFPGGQVSLRRRGLREIDVFVNGEVVAQLEFYGTDEGVFMAAGGDQQFRHNSPKPSLLSGDSLRRDQLQPAPDTRAGIVEGVGELL